MKATAANALVDPKAAAKQPDTKRGPEAEPVVCKDPEKMEGLASYIAGEMNRNIFSSEVLEMQRLNNYDSASPDREPPRLTGLGGPVARALSYVLGNLGKYSRPTYGLGSPTEAS